MVSENNEAGSVSAELAQATFRKDVKQGFWSKLMEFLVEHFDLAPKNFHDMQQPTYIDLLGLGGCPAYY